MISILKAFAWLRWRMLINALERTGSRDALERFSIAIEKLGPILAAILLIPSALGVAGLGAAAGYSLAQGAPRPILFEVCRYLLLAVTGLAILGPLFLPAADRSNPVRLLLLPIPRTVLYIGQSASAFGDPWNLLALPLLGAVAAGMAVGGEPVAALLALVAAILFVVVIIGLASLATSVLHLLVRDRRRGELIALLFIIVIPAASMLPAMLSQGPRKDRTTASRRSPVPAWVSTAGSRAMALVPSNIYVTASREAAGHNYAAAATRVAMLGAFGLVLHGLGAAAFKRVLDSPGSSGARRAASMHTAWSRRIPGLSIGESAVALAQFRLALRTPRGRSILLSPLMMFLIFGALMYRGSGTMDFGAIHLAGGPSLAMFTSAISLLAVLPIAMNQFAVDRAGLTMALLSPLTDAELLKGKAVGNALIVLAPCLLSLVASFLLFRGGTPALWTTIPLGLVSVYLLVAPIAAITSAMFPRVVDLNSIGRGSNAHGAAGLIGLLSFVVAAAPSILLALLAMKLLHRPVLAPLFAAVWCLVAFGIARLLFVAARRVFQTRRENLAML
jgi:hypothetical protein